MKWRAYPEYKASGIEWMGKIPEHWELKRAKLCSRINMGQSPRSDDCNLDGVGLPFLQGNAEFGPASPRPKQYCEVARKIARKGDLLISVRAPVGALNIADQDYGIGRGLCGITTDGSLLELPFGWYLLHQVRTQLNLHATGSTYDAVSADDVGNIVFVVPPLLEQHAIAAFLDRETERIDALIARKERQIELLQEKRAALISHAVTRGLDPNAPMKDSEIEWLGEIPEGWEVIRVKALEGNSSSVVQTGPFGAQLHAADYVDEGVPLVLIRNVANLRIDDTDIPRITHEDAERLSMYRLEVDDIAFSRVGSIGRIALCTEREKGWLISGQMLRLRIRNPKLNSRFSMYVFSSAAVLTFVALQSVGSTRESINTDILRNMPLPIPPSDEQRSIAAFLDRETERLDALVKKVQESITTLREHRTALISAAVTGKIDVRDEQVHLEKTRRLPCQLNGPNTFRGTIITSTIAGRIASRSFVRMTTISLSCAR